RQPLERARQQVVWGVIQADTRALPFRSASIPLIVANQSLPAVRSNIKRAFREISRVLKDQGVVVLTVPVGRFEEMFCLSNLCRVYGVPHFSRWLLARRLRRAEYYTVTDERGWRQYLEAAQLQVTHVRYYISQRQAFWVHLLNLQPL